ncbi:hypothetical protein A0256_17880 [Mucilaginibacter sp. PAMC 26640]|nr:hypothetical protein A0256_17880 [Mucilaginibacter sp. PAMC 26640]
MRIHNALPYKEMVVALLKAENLPVADLPYMLDNFFVAIQNDEVIGVVGLEIYNDCGLLRSFAVHPGYRGLGIGSNLLARLENLGKLKTLSVLYLLTETAVSYFEQKNYIKTTRENVPPEILRSPQFSHVCPLSAVAMKKTL